MANKVTVIISLICIIEGFAILYLLSVVAEWKSKFFRVFKMFKDFREQRWNR